SGNVPSVSVVIWWRSNRSTLFEPLLPSRCSTPHEPHSIDPIAMVELPIGGLRGTAMLASVLGGAFEAPRRHRAACDGLYSRSKPVGPHGPDVVEHSADSPVVPAEKNKTP